MSRVARFRQFFQQLVEIGYIFSEVVVQVFVLGDGALVDDVLALESVGMALGTC